MKQSKINIPVDRNATIAGDLAIPDKAKGIVVFAHGSGSGRHSPRNKMVATFLQDGGFATLLIDLLTLEEERIDSVTMHIRFDILLLAHRLIAAIDWLAKQPDTQDLDIGCFGASTGAGAALVAAAARPDQVGAVVSRGGRPDLAGADLAEVRAPTQLIVGAADPGAIRLNREAAAQLVCEHDVVIIPNATHLFEEPGTLEQVALHALNWFDKHLGAARRDLRMTS